MSASSAILELPLVTPIAAPAQSHDLEVSFVIVSFNTRDLLRECLASVLKESSSLRNEVLVVDNASSDGSADMVEREFPTVQLFRSDVNLGFGRANNLALAHARGRYFVLLNSDAFLAPGALTRAIRHMDDNPNCAMGGGLLVGRDGTWQPSARSFHTITGDAIVLSGLAAKFPRTRLFGNFDRTWADARISSPVDWVPGAFAILRPAALRQTGFFDPSFFLYYEEVDLCLRLKRAGFSVWYWPDVVVTHVGGESSRQLKSLDFSSTAAQVVLWRMRSTLLYYRKHHGSRARLAYWMERSLYRAAMLRNSFTRNQERVQRKQFFRTQRSLLQQAWKDTDGGRTSPPRPW